MTPVPEAQPADVRPAGTYTERVVLHVSADVRKRLRLFAALKDRPMSHLLDDLLRRQLPTSAELARQLDGTGASDDGQS